MAASSNPASRESAAGHTLLAVLAATLAFWMVMAQGIRIVLKDVTYEDTMWSLCIFTAIAFAAITIWVLCLGDFLLFARGICCTMMIPVIAVVMFPALPQFLANKLCDWYGRKRLRVYNNSRWMAVWPIVPCSILCCKLLDAGWDPVVITKAWWTLLVILIVSIPNLTTDDPAITNRSLKFGGSWSSYGWLLLILGCWSLIVNMPGYISTIFPKIFHRDFLMNAAMYVGPLMMVLTILLGVLFHYDVEPDETTGDDLLVGSLDTHTTLQYSLTIVVENPVRFILGICATMNMVEHDGTCRYARNVFFCRGTHRRIRAVRKNKVTKVVTP